MERRAVRHPAYERQLGMRQGGRGEQRGRRWLVVLSGWGSPGPPVEDGLRINGA